MIILKKNILNSWLKPYIHICQYKAVCISLQNINHILRKQCLRLKPKLKRDSKSYFLKKRVFKNATNNSIFRSCHIKYEYIVKYYVHILRFPSWLVHSVPMRSGILISLLWHIVFHLRSFNNKCDNSIWSLTRCSHQLSSRTQFVVLFSILY